MTTLAAALAFVSLALGSTSLRAMTVVCPQNPPVSGLLLGSPLGFTTQLHPDVQVKLAGFAPLSSPAPRPVFEQLVKDVLKTLQGKVLASDEPPILAMSLGLDVIVPKKRDLKQGVDELDQVVVPVDTPAAVLEVATHGWYAIEFSVDSAHVNVNDDLAPDVVTAISDMELDRSVFSYVLPASYPFVELLPSEEHTVRSLSPKALGLTKPEDAIHALNLHMGLYDTDLGEYENIFTERPLPPEPPVFFTLRREFATPLVKSAVAATWGGAGDSSTIYKTTWAGNHWTTPEVYRTWQDLRIPNGEKDAPILDGLAIDTRLTPQTEDDYILFSLTPTAERPVPAAEQMQLKLFESANDPPRRAVVLVDGKYRSLGKVMKAGRGIGDFCTGDPWARGGDVKISILVNMYFPDDFFVARRLPNDEQQEDVKPKDDNLRLSIAAYRQIAGTKPFVRACLSWPGGDAGPHDVIVHVGKTVDITQDPPQYVWDAQVHKMTYFGKPLVFDWPMPTDGVLRPATQAVSASSSSAPPPPPPPPCAFVIKWQLAVGDTKLISPVAALRY